jgi:hypothetical protein
MYFPNIRIALYLGTHGPMILELAGQAADGVLVESLFSGFGMRLSSTIYG